MMLKAEPIARSGLLLALALIFLAQPLPGVCVDGGRTLVGADKTLYVLDTSDPFKPELLGTLKTAGRIEDLCLIGDTAYLANGSVGLTVVDVGNPARPRLVGSYPYQYAMAVRAADGFVYLAELSKGLVILRAADRKIREVGSYLGRSVIRDLALSGNTACLAGSDEGLLLVDISRPDKPRLTGRLDIGGGRANVMRWALAVDVSGQFAYTAFQRGGMVAADISDPGNPREVARLAGNATDITVHGDRLYIAQRMNLAVVDVSNPTEPNVLGRFAADGLLSKIFFAGSRIYYNLGLIDVSRPDWPRQIAYFPGIDLIEDYHRD